jgi:hypothetical protein
MIPKPNISLTGQMQAEISGVSRGTDVSLIALGAVCLIGSLGCFFLSMWQPWAVAGAIFFLICFAFVLFVWRQGTSARAQAEAPPAQITWKSADEELALSLPLDGDNLVAKKMLSGMRTIIQNREPLPAPRGQVNGSPADRSALKEYTQEESRSIMQKLEKEASTHDLKVVELLECTPDIPVHGGSRLPEAVGVENSSMEQLPDGLGPH